MTTPEQEYERTYNLYHKSKPVKKKRAPEKNALAQIDKYLASVGALVLNTPAGLMTVEGRTFSAGQKGRSDRTVCYRGHFIAIEGKAPGRKPTAVQERYLDRVRAAGGVAIVAYSVADVKSVLDKLSDR